LTNGFTEGNEMEINFDDSRIKIWYVPAEGLQKIRDTWTAPEGNGINSKHGEELFWWA
jgi:hypothetical protein